MPTTNLLNPSFLCSSYLRTHTTNITELDSTVYPGWPCPLFEMQLGSHVHHHPLTSWLPHSWIPNFHLPLFWLNYVAKIAFFRVIILSDTLPYLWILSAFFMHKWKLASHHPFIKFIPICYKSDTLVSWILSCCFSDYNNRY